MEVDIVADMEVETVADMEVDMVTEMEVDMVTDMEVDMVATRHPNNYRKWPHMSQKWQKMHCGNIEK